MKKCSSEMHQFELADPVYKYVKGKIGDSRESESKFDPWNFGIGFLIWSGEQDKII